MEYADGPSGQERCLGSSLMIIIAYQAIGVEKSVFGAHFQGSRQVLLNTLSRVQCRFAMLNLNIWSDSAKNGLLINGADMVVLGRPADPLTPVSLSDNTGDLLGHVFGHQGPLARPLEPARVACSTTETSRSRSPGGTQTRIRA